MLFSASKIEPMKLRKKTLLIIGVTFIILIGIVYSTSATILHQVSQFEQRKTYAQIKQVQEALSNEFAQLNQTNRNWAEWDKRYNFINNAKTYIKTCLNNVNDSILNINFLLYIDSSGQIVFEKK